MNPFEPSSESDEILSNYGSGVEGELSVFGSFLDTDIRTNVAFTTFTGALEYLTGGFNLLPISKVYYDEDSALYFVSIPDTTQ